MGSVACTGAVCRNRCLTAVVTTKSSHGKARDVDKPISIPNFARTLNEVTALGPLVWNACVQLFAWLDECICGVFLWPDECICVHMALSVCACGSVCNHYNMTHTPIKYNMSTQPYPGGIQVHEDVIHLDMPKWPVVIPEVSNNWTWNAPWFLDTRIVYPNEDSKNRGKNLVRPSAIDIMWIHQVGGSFGFCVRVCVVTTQARCRLKCEFNWMN